MTSRDEIDALMNVDSSCGAPERIVPGHTLRTETADHMARYGLAAARAHGVTLDLGSGVGYGAAILATAQAVDFVIAFDISSTALAFGRTSYGGTISFVTGDAGALPLSDDSVDSVVCLEAIEHVPNAEKVLREIGRVLRADGVLVISTPNKWVTSPLFKGPINPYHVSEWYPGGFKKLISKNFEVEEVLGQSWQPAGFLWRGIRRRIRLRVKSVLHHLRLLDPIRQMRNAGRTSFTQRSEETSPEIGAPSHEEVLSSWPQEWTSGRKHGLPVTVMLIARPVRRR